MKSRSAVQTEKIMSVEKPIAIGSVFHQWTVTGEPFLKRCLYYWPVQCSCGRKRDVLGTFLRNSLTTSCRNCAARRNKMPEDLTGRTFGGWTVLHHIEIEDRPENTKNEDGHRVRAWWSRCKCGTEQAVSANQLKNNVYGCKPCRNEHQGIIMRIRPYESVYKMAKNAITKRLGRKQVYHFTISYEEFVAIIETGRCYYCHLPLRWSKYNAGKSDGVGGAYRMDRMDNNLGYVPGNVCAACKRCNYSKGAVYTSDEWYVMTEPFRNGILKHP